MKIYACWSETAFPRTGPKFIDSGRSCQFARYAVDPACRGCARKARAMDIYPTETRDIRSEPK